MKKSLKDLMMNLQAKKLRAVTLEKKMNGMKL